MGGIGKGNEGGRCGQVVARGSLSRLRTNSGSLTGGWFLLVHWAAWECGPDPLTRAGRPLGKGELAKQADRLEPALRI